MNVDNFSFRLQYWTNNTVKYIILTKMFQDYISLYQFVSEVFTDALSYENHIQELKMNYFHNYIFLINILIS